MNEKWKDIKGFEGLYKVSNCGRIKSFKKNKKDGVLIKPREKNNGYLQIGLYKEGKKYHFTIHRLVAMAFLENSKDYKSVNHKDENKKNNRVDNLEWCSVKYNNCYGDRIEKVKKKLYKKINQYDLNLNLINEYESIIEASKKTKISKGNICQCCKSKYNSTHGFIFRYK